MTVNAPQSAAWNGAEGTHWAEHQDRYDAVNSGFNDPLLNAADIAARDRVLDIGCGNGQTTRLAAARAARAVGLDLSAPMLRRARRAASREGIGNVSFEQGDAQVHPFTEHGFDVAMSRFGVMFFADPVAAFANVRRALRPGGRLVFVCLRERSDGDLGTVLDAMAEHLRAPEPADPHSPGPTSLADPDRIRRVLTGAGFADVTVEPVDAPQFWGTDPADAAGFLFEWSPVRAMLRNAEDPAARAALTEAMHRYHGPGGVQLRGAAWLVTAAR
ncbi:Ubiquinone/menaquinone biosynthesis C-methylase UbiE [Saccharopolyspora kobensis]|uniref:Ubiquinone/menaquinone biosynthesis C-methylase UbiE n=1 Tax=Saccharopolyspora kobensis TaxID=146035 RepID=A0A1H5UK50_9PSEU|nr:class I SAM-dependent methyltransferase [Saccharopolyspora kobensis]SEF74848.1 Ubiquinone/menaquinone biosynthesis C-methylase UbiE [Saccharopolyspora kobensis]SFC72957.1 Ubiquinone/menaquinone biosynthesis C-methylase UbiE [Saccharopolyspora kobensis]